MSFNDQINAFLNVNSDLKYCRYCNKPELCMICLTSIGEADLVKSLIQNKTYYVNVYKDNSLTYIYVCFGNTCEYFLVKDEINVYYNTIENANNHIQNLKEKSLVIISGESQHILNIKISDLI